MVHDAEGPAVGASPPFSVIPLPAGILRFLAVFVGLAWSAGCGGTAPAAKTAGVELQLVDHDGLMATVAGLRGKVVVLDCWSTSCPPCVREFPGLVRLAADHPGTVACMSLSFDYEGLGTVADAATRVREFLAAVHAGQVENLLGSEEADVMYRRLELDSVPAVYVWRPDGTLARRFDDDDARRRLGRAFTYADVAAEVRSLVAE
jgi:thiol-disulfide isomerase/thioredoxin